jgi:hypothetical protein
MKSNATLLAIVTSLVFTPAALAEDQLGSGTSLGPDAP